MATQAEPTNIEKDSARAKEMLSTERETLRCKGYILQNTVGEGTYSKVKRACSIALKRDVAIKIICRDEAPEVFRERFLPREIEILSVVQHPHIVKVYEIFETTMPARVYIITEYMSCGDLLDHVKDNGALEDSDAKLIFSDICRAVAYLHDNAIAHRDIKCENILLDRRRRSRRRFYAKLCDFGFARHFAGRKAKTKPEKIDSMTNTFCGSAAYASPEILERKVHNPMQADVWALGIVFFISLFGSMPFDDRDIKAMVKQQKRGDVVNNKSKKLSRLANDFVTRSLRPSPSQRPTVKLLLRHKWLHEDDSSINVGLPIQNACNRGITSSKSFGF